MMRAVCFCFCFCFCFGFISLLATFVNAKSDGNGVYIVYMGASPPTSDHAHILSSLRRRDKKSVVQTYSNGFSGFAARLSEEEAKAMAQRPGVVSVFPDPILKLHTTRSWDFLKYQSASKIDPTSISGEDTIIGILDTGIWPESESFTDEGMGPVPSGWKGECMAGLNFNKSHCNKKLIGARFYAQDEYDEVNGSPRDLMGHGSHVASTAAGRPVSGASYYGLGSGSAAGGSPGSRIAMYRVCDDEGCKGSFIMKGFDDAIADGVHVLSISLGSTPGELDFESDPISIGSFHAVEKGIIIICSAGNIGPEPRRVVNVAPWILTVAATTIDRDFEVKVILGGNKTFKGGGINFLSHNKSSSYPLIDGITAKESPNYEFDRDDARSCIPYTLDEEKIKGKIVLCWNEEDIHPPKKKMELLKDMGAVGMIMADDLLRQVATKYGVHPIAAVTKDEGSYVLSYINSTSNPTATILPTEVVANYKPAPAVAIFSSRGPIENIPTLIKPDIAAPGVAILAAWPSNDVEGALPGRDPPVFDILSGTSMACPHVSAVAALVKSKHPEWSPSAIRSAIMTTAIQTNNLNHPITTHNGSTATPYDIGAGEISLSAPFQPGLVYETEIIDYLHFLCNMGYDMIKIRKIARSLPRNFSCPGGKSLDSISNMNYPSIAISGLVANGVKMVKRTVTNVGVEDSVYSHNVEAPDGLHVEVEPKKLKFSKDVKTLSFEVKFKLDENPRDDLFGSITWSNEENKVRSPFVVRKH